MKSRFKLSFNSKVMMVVISLVCVITMLMVPSLVLASDTTDNARSSIQPRWSCLYECDNGIDYASDISKGIKIYGATLTYDDYYAEVEMQLEKYTSSGVWVNVPTYSWSAYAEGTFVDIEKDNISLSSGTYRCSLLHTAYDPSGFPLESAAFYTLEITIR